MRFGFTVLHPVHSEKYDPSIFSSHVYGIKLNSPELAKLCVYNLNPRYTDGHRTERATIENALSTKLPSYDLTLGIECVDIDSVGAMAVLVIRFSDELLGSPALCPVCGGSGKLAGQPASGDSQAPEDCLTCDGLGWNPELLARIYLISDQYKDAFHKPLIGDLADLAALVSDFSISLEDQGEIMKGWLLFGEIPERYHLAAWNGVIDGIGPGDRVKSLKAEERGEVIGAKNDRATFLVLFDGSDALSEVPRTDLESE